MALYAVGDVQGCFGELKELLARLRFDPGRDHIWFTGDLVNRGPRSADVLRFVRDLGERAVTVLGNHDLHLLAIGRGTARPSPRDALDDVLSASDRDDLLEWLAGQPLLHHDAASGYTLLHAGLVPQWDLATAMRLAQEAEQVVRGEHAEEFFGHMYGDEPAQWDEGLSGWSRIRFVVNVLTRLRFCDAQGRIALAHKGPPGTQPAPLRPWFEHHRAGHGDLKVIFGHWSLLGARRVGNHIALDSGCLWGRTLTAVRLDAESLPFTQVPCTAKLTPRDVGH